MSEPAVTIEGLYKSYRSGLFGRRRFEAVKGIDLSIAKGEAWALAGPNGAGKTTTLLCLLGLLAPDAGRVRLLGRDPADASTRRALGYQSEIFFAHPFLTGRQTLAFYGRLSGLQGADLERAIDAGLDAFDLRESAGRRVGGYSKGMTQRLGLAQSLLTDPDIVIWDEPSTGLDPEGRRLVADRVADLRRRGKTILLSTHILSDVERACDHLAIVSQGELKAADAIDALRARDPGKSLEDVYLDTVKGAGRGL